MLKALCEFGLNSPNGLGLNKNDKHFKISKIICLDIESEQEYELTSPIS